MRVDGEADDRVDWAPLVDDETDGVFRDDADGMVDVVFRDGVVRLPRSVWVRTALLFLLSVFVVVVLK